MKLKNYNMKLTEEEVMDMKYKNDYRATDIYVRDIDPGVKKKLEIKAKEKGISLNILIKSILEEYTLNPEVRYAEEKYIALIKDITAAFISECRKNQERMEELSYIIKDMTK